MAELIIKKDRVEYGYKPYRQHHSIHNDATTLSQPGRATGRFLVHPAGRVMAVPMGKPLPIGYEKITEKKLRRHFPADYIDEVKQNALNAIR